MAEQNWFFEFFYKVSGGNEGAMDSFSQFFGESGLLSQIGFYTYILPFFLVFAVSYAALTQIPPFNDQDSKRVPAIVALVFGLYVTTSTGFLKWYKTISEGITQMLAVILIIVVFLLIVYEMLKAFEED